MSAQSPVLTARFWRNRRSAAIAGIVFGVLLLASLTMTGIALSEDSLQSLESDAQRRTLIRLSLHLVPFAGIAFLWFIGVIRCARGPARALPRPAGQCRGPPVLHGVPR